MTTETRIAALDFASKLSSGHGDAKSLITHAAEIETWLTAEDPVEPPLNRAAIDDMITTRVYNAQGGERAMRRMENGQLFAKWSAITVVLVLALAAICYLVFEANSGPRTPATVETTQQ